MSDFEVFLTALVADLTMSVRTVPVKNAADFERLIRKTINANGGYLGRGVSEEPKVQEFPDIPVGRFGIEVKFTENDTWRSIANSVSEGSRNSAVEEIFVVFGKMGGTAEVRFGRYEDVVMHVRTSHVPRFEIEMGTTDPLFSKFGIGYVDFQKLSMHEKMEHIRAYARGRLKPGERLWWLEDSEKVDNTLPLQVGLYINLPQAEKRKLRAEGCLLSPGVVAGSRSRGKYNDVVMYILTRYGVLCSQARDLFTAGSVALRGNPERGGLYMVRAMSDIENEMLAAAKYLDDSLFVEYWGKSCAPEKRISEWLKMADSIAKGWKPSDHLFVSQN